jgi:NitT/TauT family transport system ATP-binding protein
MHHRSGNGWTPEEVVMRLAGHVPLTDPKPQGHRAGPAPAIEVRSVSKRYPTERRVPDVQPALDRVSVQVDRNRFVALVGPNGCGKSTLLHLMAGLQFPTGGSIWVHGAPLVGLNRRATYMFQQDALLPWKTALENMVLPLSFRGHDRAAALELGRQWLSRVGLDLFADYYPHQLSGGMRRRVAIAQSWITDADIVLMDEPFSALDAQTRQLTEEGLLGLWTASPRTVVLVTHDLAEAIALCDEVVLFSAGPASRVVGTYPVSLARPRPLDELPFDSTFRELCRTIGRDLRAEVLKSHERTHRDR